MEGYPRRDYVTRYGYLYLRRIGDRFCVCSTVLFFVTDYPLEGFPIGRPRLTRHHCQGVYYAHAVVV